MLSVIKVHHIILINVGVIRPQYQHTNQCTDYPVPCICTCILRGHKHGL